MTVLLLDQVRNGESIYEPVPARIVSIRELTTQDKLFALALPTGMALNHLPGQFVQVSVPGVGEAPISISSSPSRTNATFELAIRRVGDLTGVLHRMEPGEIIGVRGPFGRGFPMEWFKGKDLLFVAGGCGIAPLRSLINEVLDNRGDYGHLQILYGSQAPADFLFKDELHIWEHRSDLELHLSVDTADYLWAGCVGFVTNLFPEVKVDPRNAAAVIIGPPVMYKSAIQQCKMKGLVDGNIWLSFERRMKCGVGKCGHCQIQHIYTCIEGPTFKYSEIKGVEEAL